MSPEKESNLSMSAAEAEVRAARADLARTVDALSNRLDPRVRGAEAAQAAKQAAHDARGLLTGKGAPQHDRERTRNLKILIGVALGTAALITLAVARRR